MFRIGFPNGLAGKESTCNARDTVGLGSSPGWGDPLEKEMTPSPGFLPEKSHGQRSLVGYGPWGHKKSDLS